MWLYLILSVYLLSLPKSSDYVLPEHADIYLRDSSLISRRVKRFLDDLGIINVKKINSRSVSIKDLHSCRHTFCYLAGVSGIPITVVQSIVGHMSSEMTAYYSSHVTLDDKRRLMALMPSIDSNTILPTNRKSEIIKLLDNASDDKLKMILDILLS